MDSIKSNTTDNLTKQFNEIVEFIKETRKKIFRVANSALIELYWHIGERLSYRISQSQWGEGVIRQLADYISENTEDSRSFSDKNLWRMKQFYETYKDCDEKLSSLLRQINWTNNLTIMSRCKTFEEKMFYIQLTVDERLSTRELGRVIDRGLFERTMLDKPKLSAVLREIAPSTERSFRDRYIIDFIGGKTYSDEYSLKQAIIAKMKDFMLEVGKDFLYIYGAGIPTPGWLRGFSHRFIVFP